MITYYINIYWIDVVRKHFWKESFNILNIKLSSNFFPLHCIFFRLNILCRANLQTLKCLNTYTYIIEVLTTIFSFILNQFTLPFQFDLFLILKRACKIILFNKNSWNRHEWMLKACIIKNILIADFSSGLKKKIAIRHPVQKLFKWLNQPIWQSLTHTHVKDSTIVYLFKYVSKTTIYGLKVMVKSG